MWKMLLPMTGEGFKVSISVFLITLVFSLPLGVVVAALRRSGSRLVQNLVAGYITLMRGTPLLLQLMFLFFGFPFVPVIGYAFGRYEAIAIAFVLNYAAYFAEIFRGGIQSIDIGQWEAGAVLGLTRFQTFTRIILPQVIKNVWTAVANEVITLVKDTSLVYILGVSDLMKAAKSVSNTFSSFTPYLFIGAIYLLIIAILTKLLSYVEKKMEYY
ncbi:amino acid ABC transporter permease [Clostridiales bacterium COT073_COT-073]|nr:amino acid ABC transporter permease [Clostridiales bacterium COT073_COT-073]